MNASGTTHTFRFEAGSQRLLGIGAVIGGIGCLAFVVAALAYPSSSWAQGGSTPGAILLTGLGLFVLWSGIRLIRMGVQVSAGQLTIRRFLSTRTAKASDIRAIYLEPKVDAEGWGHWIPVVDLADGNRISMDWLDCGSSALRPIPERAAAIDELRALLGL